ncbi:MAG: nucleotidyltransferase [Candidatus Cyclonatronum sp.]|uniref:nucleotidyltransferase family protein n=1 Tax=Cyclonatronum sp. TaxID=3024185 RepID=UPI0025BE2BBB|nr:sugar phosphate nucleotidyltransferase [Cyclonatronum sp.]MCH8485968.1 nucleotidyltransferase [Cyclonatronum sp.]
MSKPALVIMAAGTGSRFGGLKQLAAAGPLNQRIIDYSVYDARRAGFGKIVFVIRKQTEVIFRDEVLKPFEDRFETELVFQEPDELPAGFTAPPGRLKPWGTGHALLAAEKAVHTPFCVINADDFYGEAAFRQMAEFLRQHATSNHYAMAAYRLEKTLSAFGSVSRGVCETDENGFLKSVQEHKNISRKAELILSGEAPDGIPLSPQTLVSMNCWGFAPSVFTHLLSGFVRFLDARINQPEAEFHLPAVIDRMIRQQRAKVSVLDSGSDWFGITYPPDLEHIRSRIRQMTESGEYPENLWPRKTH